MGHTFGQPFIEYICMTLTQDRSRRDTILIEFEDDFTSQCKVKPAAVTDIRTSRGTRETWPYRSSRDVLTSTRPFI